MPESMGDLATTYVHVVARLPEGLRLRIWTEDPAASSASAGVPPLCSPRAAPRATRALPHLGQMQL